MGAPPITVRSEIGKLRSQSVPRALTSEPIRGQSQAPPPPRPLHPPGGSLQHPASGTQSAFSAGPAPAPPCDVRTGASGAFEPGGPGELARREVRGDGTRSEREVGCLQKPAYEALGRTLGFTGFFFGERAPG